MQLLAVFGEELPQGRYRNDRKAITDQVKLKANCGDDPAGEGSTQVGAQYDSHGISEGEDTGFNKSQNQQGYD